MEFKDYLYKRPDFDLIQKEIENKISLIKKAESPKEVINLFEEFNKIRSNYQTNSVISSIRYTLDTSDEFYSKEKDFFDEYDSLFTKVENEFLKAFYESKFKEDLINTYGIKLFDTIKVNLEIFSEEIIPLLQEQARLCSRYTKLISKAKLLFDGKELNLAQIRPYLISPDRKIRKESEKVYWDFFKDNEEEFDEILDKLVKLRHEQALKLGFENFVELGYKSLMRTEYNSSDVKRFRDNVVSNLVSICNVIYEKQRQRIKLDKLYSYDLSLFYLDGNATPLYDEAYKINTAKEIYHKMGQETKEFVDFMMEHKLLDLTARNNKSGGGYCTFMKNYKSPFVFANFNGTSSDIDVLTHEFGHAFQVYCSKDIEVLEYIWPTYEACEIHSMSMEFFAYPYMDKFFGSDVSKYKYSHLADSITFIPYACLIDEFQHKLYENPTLTPLQRKEIFRDLEKKYTPHKVYENEFLEKGSLYMRQSHIYEVPFYYIDYALAQNCAHQFFIKSVENREKAWNDYVSLCKLGGSKTFLKLVECANLVNPFTKESDVSKKLLKLLEKFENEL